MKSRISFFFVLLIISTSIYAQKVMRIGIIGLDTSHSTAFTELINGGSDETFSKGFRVVAAYPYGSKTIQSSYERIPGYIEKVKETGSGNCSFHSQPADQSRLRTLRDQRWTTPSGASDGSVQGRKNLLY